VGRRNASNKLGDTLGFQSTVFGWPTVAWAPFTKHLLQLLLLREGQAALRGPSGAWAGGRPGLFVTVVSQR